jgi:methyl-accepting chemotaxis protein
LAQSGVDGLKQARDALAQSDLGSAENKQLLVALDALRTSLQHYASMDNLSAQREVILQAKTQIAKTAEAQSKQINGNFSEELKRAEEGISYARLFTILTAIAAFLLARALINGIHRPLQAAIGMADRIAQGKLNHSPAPENGTEIGKLSRALNGMNARLREMVGNIMDTSHRVGEGSDAIMANNTTLIERAEAEATTLEQTSASLEELTSSVGKNADRTQTAQALAQEAVAHVEASSDVVRQVVSTIGDIRSSSQRIVDIIAMIDGIAFQTNILALNAAVEAARAGEQGAGFAVVASEVRSLAQRCTAAAKDIKSLIGESAKKIRIGTDLADVAGKAMESTVISIQQVSALLDGIAATSTEQKEGIAQINQAMILLDQATHRSGAVVDQAGNIAHQLSQNALALNNLVRQFDLGAQRTIAKPAAAVQQHIAQPAKSAPPPRAKPLTGKAALEADADNWTEF